MTCYSTTKLCIVEYTKVVVFGVACNERLSDALIT